MIAEKALQTVNLSLRRFIEDWEAALADSEENEDWREDRLELICAEFADWAKGWLRQQGMSTNNPLLETIFQWSSFVPQFFNCGEDFLISRSEYASAKQAESQIKLEDGESAWDDDGHPMRKMLFAIYGDVAQKNGWHFQTDDWDSNRTDLIGCVTIKDWEWERYAGEDIEDFTEENVRERLYAELHELEAWLKETTT